MPDSNDVQSNPEAENTKCQIQLESINRLSNVPCVETTINKTTEIYEKVKESSVATKLILESAEHTVHKTASLAEPVVTTLEKPIKMADNFVCNTMDFIGEQIPKVKETPQKIKNIVSSVPVQPAVDCVKAVGNYGVQTVSNLCTQFQNETQNTQENETIPETES